MNVSDILWACCMNLLKKQSLLLYSFRVCSPHNSFLCNHTTSQRAPCASLSSPKALVNTHNPPEPLGWPLSAGAPGGVTHPSDISGHLFLFIHAEQSFKELEGSCKTCHLPGEPLYGFPPSRDRLLHMSHQKVGISSKLQSQEHLSVSVDYWQGLSEDKNSAVPENSQGHQLETPLIQLFSLLIVF